MEKLFGTDGIRGIANQYPITSDMAVNIGRAAAYKFKDENRDSYIVVGKDTRISGDMLLHGIASGICSTGVNVYSAGILPTPAIAQLTAATGSKAGIMISASHNPYYDNGIKLFNNRGFKLSSDMEDEIEDLALKRNFYKNACKVQSIGTVFSLDDAKIIYKNFIKEIFNNGFSLKGMKIVIDCSNGASYRIAPEIFRDLGAQVHVLFDAPDGKNINDHCGSQHPEKMRKYVIEKAPTQDLLLTVTAIELLRLMKMVP
jgi:phosphoglucosamine mutase